DSLHCILASSPSNYLTIDGPFGLSPVSFTLRFSRLVERVQFTRPGICDPPGPQWSAHAYSSAGAELAAIHEDGCTNFICTQQFWPAQIFTLGVPGIAAVRFDLPQVQSTPRIALDDLLITFPASNAFPSVLITSPTNGAAFTAPTNIPIMVDASDPDGSIRRLDFYDGAALIGVVTNAPFTLVWTNAHPGNHGLKAVATDDGGAATVSGIVNIVIDPPTVAVQPLSRTVEQGSTVSFAVVATGSPPLAYQW